MQIDFKLDAQMEIKTLVFTQPSLINTLKLFLPFKISCLPLGKPKKKKKKKHNILEVKLLFKVLFIFSVLKMSEGSKHRLS